MTIVPTWATLGVEEMRRGMMLMLQGNPYFAWQYVATNDEGKPKQKYTPCRYLNQLTQFEVDIFEGRKTVGFYIIRPDNLTRVGVLDFDNHDGRHSRDFWLPHAQRAYDTLAKRFPEVWLVESSPGCYHVIPFASELMTASDMRAILSEIAPEGIEVFPKQDSIRHADPKAKGSLLRFPGKHQFRDCWARIIARSGRVTDPEEIIPAPTPSNWIEPSTEGRLRSLYVVATRGIEISRTGQRFDAIKSIAGRLKGRANESEALWVYTAWHKHNAQRISTPFPEARRQFLAWFHKAEPCIAEVPDYPLTETEQTMLANLPKFDDVKAVHLVAVVRLLLCAERFAKEKGEPTFWRSCRDIAKHIKTSERTANRVRCAAVKALGLEVAKKGSTGYATEYKFRS